MNTTMSLPSLASDFKVSAAYWGERGDWLIALTQTRDSDTLARSNWRTLLAQLGGESDTVAIERASHCMCGWVEYLIVDPADAARVALAEEAAEKIEAYPALDEDDWSQLEHDEYYTFFCRDAAGEFRRQLGDCTVSDLAVDRVCDLPADTLIEWFEAQIPSGECQTDGYPNFSLAFDRVTRVELAKLVRLTRK